MNKTSGYETIRSNRTGWLRRLAQKSRSAHVGAHVSLIGLCFLVASHVGQIRDPRHDQAFTIAHIVIGLSLHIHSFIRLKYDY